MTGGLQPGNLIVIAARPSMGKSCLVTNIAENAAITHSKPVALFSLEMSETELARRFIASQASVRGEDLSKGRVPEAAWPKIVKASSKLAQAPAVGRRLGRHRHARDPRQGAPPVLAEPGRASAS